MDAISGDRRKRRRYDLQFPLVYRCLWEGKLVMTGAGRTVDMSAQGVRFMAGAVLPESSRVELMINWPVPASSGKPIVLMAFGTVVRNADQCAGVRVAHYEFLSDMENRPLPAIPEQLPAAGQKNRVQVHELRRRLCELLRRVEAGDVLMVYRRSLPIAEIRPVSPPGLPATGTE